MSSHFIPMQKLVREIKDKAIQNYFNYRIYSHPDPYKIQFRQKSYQVLFILSHMRSGSSLLTHLLNSNPEIIGYGETHLKYTCEADFKKLIYRVYWKIRDYRMNHLYILDKVLHDHILDTNILKSNQLKAIFLLREPQRTLSSILTIKPHWSEEKTVNYYIERLGQLVQYATIINDNQKSLLITYDQVIKQTNQVFEALHKTLSTHQGFSENYQVLQTTGTKGVGDSSPNIKTGKIMRQSQPLAYEISSDCIRKADVEFERCLETLSQLCTVISI